MPRLPKQTPNPDLTPARILAAREALGLSQHDFGLLVGRREGRGAFPSVVTVSSWERGTRHPGREFAGALRAICVETEARRPLARR